MKQPYALIIEDDPKLGIIFQTALQQAGYETDLDANGNQYRAFLDARRPDLVILDLHLPFAFGGDILDVIRDKYPDAMIAIVTADFIKAKTLTGKADHILVKPVSVIETCRISKRINMPKPFALIVEDDAQLSQIFTLALSDSFETEAITDGLSALARLAEVSPNLVVLDINLPGASGAEILSFIRANSDLNSTRVILATADSRQAETLQDKADIVLLKPVSIIQLRELAERLK